MQKKTHDKSIKRLKKSNLYIDKEIYKIAMYEVQKLSSYKKKILLENRFNDSIDKPKEFWKALKSIGFSCKISVWGANALKVNNTMSFEAKSTLDIFKNYYSTLVDNFLKKPRPLQRTIILTL